MARVSRVHFQHVLDEHRRRLARVIDYAGVRSMKRLYDAATAELLHKIQRIAPSRMRSFEAHHHRIVLAELKQGGALLARRLYGDLGDLSREAQLEAVRGLDVMITRLERQYSGSTPVLPTAEAARFAVPIDESGTQSLLRQFPRGTENRIKRVEERKVTGRMPLQERQAVAVANLASRLITDAEKQLSVSTLLAEPSAQTIERIEKVMDLRWSDAERVVRTESSWAAQSSARAGINAATDVLPDMKSRWCEHLDEATLTPLDDRVSVDSIALHSQVADEGDFFTMPALAPRGTLKEPEKIEVPEALVGMQWTHPPDRPRDRSVLAPWRPGWNLPAYSFVNGRRVTLV